MVGGFQDIGRRRLTRVRAGRRVGAQSVKRTSSLESPTMLLTGHASMVTGCKFNPEGSAIASCSHDKHVFLWNVQVRVCAREQRF